MKYTVVGARGRVRRVEEFMERLQDEAAGLHLAVQAFNARMVFGQDHILSAAEHADRAFQRGTNVAKERMIEVLVYASGERQISAAFEKVGLKEGLEDLVILAAGQGDVDALLSRMGLERDDSLIVGEEEMLPAFGISAEEIRSVTKDRPFDLVLERVALVDLLK